MSTPLPTPRQIVTSLIKSISADLPSTDGGEGNPLLHPPSSTKSLLLTLHVLYPTEFLPALDLLDRNLITRLIVRDESQQAEGTTATEPLVYFLRSAQQTTSNSRFRDAMAIPYYEVRTRSWNCSCPAFAFSAFPAAAEDDFDEEIHGAEEERPEWTFGGISRGKAVPVCKHLLACVLVERVEALKGRMAVSEVTKEELAGWAAGWSG
jgi:hypothetical protein